MTDYLQVFSAIAAVLVILYYYFTSTFDFWKRRGVPGPQPIIGFGNIKDIIFARQSLGNYVTKIYNEYKNEPMIGMFMRRTPTLVVCDLDLVKNVLIKNFSTFDDRGINVFEKAEPLSVNIFNLEPERWRTLRTRLSPVFTSGKIKEMFPLILECSEQLEKYLEKLAEEGKAVECREMAAKFTTDVIGSCAFGINMNALSDEECEFRRMGKEIFTFRPSRLVRLAFRESMPWLYRIVGCLLPESEVNIFFTKVISETMAYRKQNNIVRPDFVNMLMELKDHPDKLHNIEITDSILTAQAVVFFAAGFETSSTTIGHALYEMALNPHMQDKLREEIRECNEKTNGDFDYESVKGMKYLDKVFKETLRKYPPGMILRRKNNENYTFNDTKVSIPKNIRILIPVYAIHHDPSVYPNPETFDPERFNEDAVAARHPMSYLPFGDGPRNCIGARFAIYQTKVGLIKMLQNFKFDLCDETITSYVQNPISLVLSPKGGLRLKISKSQRSLDYDRGETMPSYLEIFCGIAALILAAYYYFVSPYDFWKIRNVPGPKPAPPFGNIKDVMLLRTSLADYLKKLYEEYRNEPMIGIFTRRTPVLILHDSDAIKDVLIRDFSKFADRGINVNEKMEPLSPHLFNLEPERWRPLRTRLSPVFTSGKIKEMFPLIVECSEHLDKYLEKLVAKGEPVECRELTAKYTTDVIGSCAFGIETNALSDQESEFRRMGKKVFASTFWQLVRFRMRQAVPWFYNLLGYIVPPSDITTFFTKVVVDTMNYREESKTVRPDFINMLLELKKHPDKLENIKLTDTLLTAQAFVFFIAGFETSSSAMSNTLYELALNPDVQDKLRKEIREYCDNNDGELKYEQIKDMKYLDKVFREALRKYPPGPILLRKSISDYTFESTKLTIPNKTMVWIPLFAIHRDPKIYPNPDAFMPERFDDDAASARHPMNYLPFGDGPRNCIGARFAVFQSKVGLIKILRNHRVDVCEKTMIPYVFDRGAFLLAPKGGIYLKITKAEN
ncbi:uncharacterized protein LOC128878552 [Hylaeus volcanicus]|uniref:uncharacterized protein LOC128878552 n=1 Tax=Hylaeus volcanicus TaxID=313075 RepID=UPI0023B86674|nr:uncharacterized protein LOC128878552 [Hylaeus volcanicus]